MKAVKLYTYDLKKQVKVEDFDSWGEFVEALEFAELDKSLGYKDFKEAPTGWSDDLFGEFTEMRIIKTLVPPSMKSANDKAKTNYRMAHVAISKQPSDRLQVEGDMRRIVGWGCTCSYKAGSIGNIA
jgi:hypothetical protein